MAVFILLHPDEAEILKTLLGDYVEELQHHGCNDIHVSDTAYNRALIAAMADCDPMEVTESGGKIIGCDFALANYFWQKVDKALKQRGQKGGETSGGSEDRDIREGKRS